MPYGPIAGSSLDYDGKNLFAVQHTRVETLVGVYTVRLYTVPGARVQPEH